MEWGGWNGDERWSGEDRMGMRGGVGRMEWG